MIAALYYEPRSAVEFYGFNVKSSESSEVKRIILYVKFKGNIEFLNNTYAFKILQCVNYTYVYIDFS